MSLGVRVKFGDDGLVLAALARLALDRGDKTDLLNEIGINLAENTRLRFTDQTAPDGTKWEPSLRALAQGGETMRDTGRLLSSIVHQVEGDGVEIGTNFEHADVLHFGATIKARAGGFLSFPVPGGGWAMKKEVTIPARPFLGLDSDDEELVVDLITEFLKTER